MLKKTCKGTKHQHQGMRNLHATPAEPKVYCCQAHCKNALTIRLIPENA